MRKAENAYLTVEAALVMPMVLGVILLIIYLLFFQYDRCLMEQETGILAMRGCTLQAEDQEQLARMLQREAEQADGERYLAWEPGEVRVTLQGGRVTAEQAGELKFPFRGIMSWDQESRWKTTARYRNQRIRPADFIRNCQRVMGGN